MADNLKQIVVLGVMVGGLGLYTYMRSRKQKNYQKVATVAKLYLHPVKSLAAIEVNEGEVTSIGFKSNGIYDRSFMVIDENSHFVTARKCPKMILIRPSFSDDGKYLNLSADGQQDISIPLNCSGSTIKSRVWGNEVSGYDCGDEIANWLSEFMEGTYRLAYYSAELPGKLIKKDAQFGHHMKHHETSMYQDCTQYNILSEASVDDLNTRIDEKITERNFRPNIFVNNCSAYAEDFWKYVKVGDDAELRFTHYCGRCKMTTLNQKTGSYTSLDPLKTLKEYRQCYDFMADKKNYATSPIFGVNLNLERGGIVKVGDPVYASLQFQEYM